MVISIAFWSLASWTFVENSVDCPCLPLKHPIIAVSYGPTVNSHKEAFKALPSVDKALKSESLKSLVKDHGHEAVKQVVRAQLELARTSIAEGDKAISQSISRGDFFVDFCNETALAVIASFLFLVTAYVIYLNIGENPLSNKEAMIASATIQKFIAFMSVATVFSLSFGFSKRINNSK